jgi:hypothetical protein
VREQHTPRARRPPFSWLGCAAGFLAALALAGCLNALTYLGSYNAPASDGRQVAGFPLTFWWSGGLTPPGAPTGGFDRGAAVTDALLAVLGAAAVGAGAGFVGPRLSGPGGGSRGG